MRGEIFQKLGELVIYSLLSKTHFVETYKKKHRSTIGLLWVFMDKKQHRTHPNANPLSATFFWSNAEHPSAAFC